MYGLVDGVHDEWDGAQSEGGGGPLPRPLRHPRRHPSQPVERGGADTVYGEAGDEDGGQGLPEQGVEGRDPHAGRAVGVAGRKRRAHLGGLVVGVGQDVGRGHAVAQPHPPHVDQGSVGEKNGYKLCGFFWQ